MEMPKDLYTIPAQFLEDHKPFLKEISTFRENGDLFISDLCGRVICLVRLTPKFSIPYAGIENVAHYPKPRIDVFVKYLDQDIFDDDIVDQNADIQIRFYPDFEDEIWQVSAFVSEYAFDELECTRALVEQYEAAASKSNGFNRKAYSGIEIPR